MKEEKKHLVADWEFPIHGETKVGKEQMPKKE